jgi:hypothetical protein
MFIATGWQKTAFQACGPATHLLKRDDNGWEADRAPEKVHWKGPFEFRVIEHGQLLGFRGLDKEQNARKHNREWSVGRQEDWMDLFRLQKKKLILMLNRTTEAIQDDYYRVESTGVVPRTTLLGSHKLFSILTLVKKSNTWGHRHSLEIFTSARIQQLHNSNQPLYFKHGRWTCHILQESLRRSSKVMTR